MRDTYWQATDEAVLVSAIAALPEGYAAAPIRGMDTAAGRVWCALVRGPKQAQPPAGVLLDTAEAARTAVGVFATGPDGRVDPRDWMDRIPRQKQVAITAVAASNPPILLMLLRLAAGKVDPGAAETREGVAAMLAAQLIDAEDARGLLFGAAAAIE